MKEKIIFIYVTTANEKEAKAIATLLLEKKLIACANFFPIKSMYSWEGKTRCDSEVVLLLKTLEGKYLSIVKEITEIHSYEVPCISKFEATANTEFGKWVREMVK